MQKPEFCVQDGNPWQEWRLSAPIFEQFFILGPKSFDKSADPDVLYQNSATASDSGCGIGRFIFDQGLDLRQEKLSREDKIKMLEAPNEVKDRLVLVRKEAGFSLFTHCVTFRASVFTRPTTPGLGSVEETYKAVMGKKVATALFAFCFTTAHPFFDFFFKLVDTFLEMAARNRQQSRFFEALQKPKEMQKCAHDVKENWLWWEMEMNERESLLEMLRFMHMPSFDERFMFQYYGRNDSINFKWKMPLPGDVMMSVCKLGCFPLMSWIGEDDFIMLLSSILLEHVIIVAGSSMSDVVNTVTYLSQLPCPFSWVLPTVNIVPRDLLELLESPGGLMCGIMANILPARKEHHVIVNLDEEKIEFVRGTVKLLNSDVLLKRLQPFFDKQKEKRREKKKEKKRDRKRENKLSVDDIEEFLRNIEAFLTEHIAAPMASKLKRGVDREGRSGTDFNLNAFLSSFKGEAEAFVRAFTDGQMFMTFKEQLCRTFTKEQKVIRQLQNTFTRWCDGAGAPQVQDEMTLGRFFGLVQPEDDRSPDEDEIASELGKILNGDGLPVTPDLAGRSRAQRRPEYVQEKIRAIVLNEIAEREGQSRALLKMCMDA